MIPLVTNGYRKLFYMDIVTLYFTVHCVLGMADVVYLLNSLVDKDGKIIITNLYKEVAPIFDGEKEMYENIEFDPIEYK